MYRSHVFLLTLYSIFLSGSLWAYQSPEAFLKEADGMLDSRRMDRLIPRDNLVAVAKLAQDEDMEPLDQYLISDDTLRLLRRTSLIGTDFGRLMEEYQAECDRQGGDQKVMALSEWRSLWLEKVSQHLRYVRSLEPVWSFSLRQTFDHTNNVLLADPDDPASAGTDKDDSGMGISGGLSYMPLLNHNKDKSWDYVGTFGLGSQFQGTEEELEYDTVNISNLFVLREPFDHVRRATVKWDFFRLYSSNPNGNSSSDFHRHALTFSLDGKARKMREGAYFDAYLPKVSFQYRLKKEIGDNLLDDASVSLSEIDVSTLQLKFGWSYLRSRKDEAFSSLGWTFDYQQESANDKKSRDYGSYGLRVSYFRSLEGLLPSRVLNWNSSVYYRIRNYDSPVANTDDSIDEILMLTSLNTSWSASLSSSLSFSYLNKSIDVSSPTTRLANESKNQWKVMWMNRFVTP
jgi:hypothetical protein